MNTTTDYNPNTRRLPVYLVDSEKAFIAKTMGVMQCFWSQKLQAIR